MLFACPQCAARYDEPIELLAQHAYRVKCFVCREIFDVQKTGEPPPMSLDAFADGQDPFDEDTHDDDPSDELMVELVGLGTGEEAARPDLEFSEQDQDMFNESTRQAQLTPELLALLKQSKPSSKK